VSILYSRLHLDIDVSLDKYLDLWYNRIVPKRGVKMNQFERIFIKEWSDEIRCLAQVISAKPMTPLNAQNTLAELLYDLWLNANPILNDENLHSRLLMAAMNEVDLQAIARDALGFTKDEILQEELKEAIGNLEE
jgi:hypothetical protein